MNASDGGERRSVNPIQDLVDAFEEIAHALKRMGCFHHARTFLQFSQIGAGAETGTHLTVNDERVRISFQAIQCGDKLLKFVER
jgi:hypothetical protein